MELKSNFHGREWIMERVRKHYETAVAYFGSEKFVVGAFLVGSQNYKLDIETSDVDVKVFVLPSLESIIELGAPESSTWVSEGGEHEDFKDFRLVIKELEKGSPNMLETLFTDYYIINPDYSFIIARLRAYRERIANNNQKGIFNAFYGMAQRFIKLYNEGKSDIKSVVTLLRIRDFIYSYFVLGETYNKSLVPSNLFTLRTLRTQPVEQEKLKAFVDEATKDLEEFKSFSEKKTAHSNDTLGKVVLRDILYDLMYTHLKNEVKDFGFTNFNEVIKNESVLL